MKALLIGHIALDIRDGEEFKGGSILYQIPILNAFNAEITCITSASEINTIEEFQNVKIINIKSRNTTTYQFLSNSSSNERTLKLIRRANEITIDCISKVKNEFFDFVIVSPIANEISNDTLDYIISNFNNVYLDMQGFIRYFDRNGIVKIKMDYNLISKLLPNVQVLKISEEEYPNHQSIKNKYNSKLIITKGGHGYCIYSDNKVQEIKTKPILVTNDTTGSGDIFLVSLACFAINQPFEKAIKLADLFARENLMNYGIPSSTTYVKLLNQLLN